MNYDDNKHCTETAYSCRYHYKQTYSSGSGDHVIVACGEKDDPTRIELRPKNGGWPTLDFRMPDQRHELERVERLMLNAYEQGKSDKMREISSTLKTVIGL